MTSLRSLFGPARPDKVVTGGNSTYDGAPYNLNPVALPADHPQKGPVKGAAKPGDTFTEPTITAEDAINAAKLGPLGYVSKTPAAWASGTFMTVSGFRFAWDGVVWVYGPKA